MSGDQMAPYDLPNPDGRPFEELDELTLLACLCAGEARNQEELGQVAVAWVVRNRAMSGKTKWFGDGYRGVILKRWQFSAFNEGDLNRDKMLSPLRLFQAGVWGKAYKAAAAVYFGFVPDPTDDADHYFAINIDPPYWADPNRETAMIGHHRFFRLR